MINRTQPADPAAAASTFATELPQAPVQSLAVYVPPQPTPYAPPAAPAVYLPAIKDFLVTSLPVPLTAAVGGAVTALAGGHYASDILVAAMFCATLLGVPGTFLMSKLLRNRQNDAKVAVAQLPAPATPAQLPAAPPPGSA